VKLWKQYALGVLLGLVVLGLLFAWATVDERYCDTELGVWIGCER
jgi:hypothetical protein